MLDKLQYISQGNTLTEHVENIRIVLDAGCQWIQLRYKNKVELMDGSALKEVKKRCEQYRATFIINDHLDLVQRSGANGVHLGLNDTSVQEARALLGENYIIGGTANTFEDVLQRIEEKCDYIGLGPFRFTTTKDKLSPVLGIEGYREIIAKIDDLQAPPIYAIGGITTADIEPILQTGIYGIAVSSLLTQDQNTKSIVEQIKNKLYVNS